MSSVLPAQASDTSSASAVSATPEAGSGSSADWLARLNPAQRRAATFGRPLAGGGVGAPPLLVIAGAGTGKTATLAHRVAWLVLSGVDPQRILLLTFSRRAAQEMTRRAERLVAEAWHAQRRSAGGRGGAAVRLTWAGTFHAVGARLLREHASRVGLDPSFGILDRGDAADLLDVIRHDLGLSAKARRFPRKDTCLAIYSYRINTGWPLQRVLDEAYPWCAEWADDLGELFKAYVERKLAHSVLDYDDLLLWWHAAMSDAQLAAQIGAGFDHVLVDEFQDTNALQAQILHALKPAGAGLTVVGDDAQSIYSFRAADVGNILAFPQCFDPPADRITLEQNYRSRQPVLDAANLLIAEGRRQYPKTLRAVRGGGARPRLVTVLDDRAQADYVIDEVLAQREAGVPLKRQAVLFRSGHHSDTLEVELSRRNVPFVKYGGLKFLEALHIKDVLAVLRWADNARNGIAAFRVLQMLDGIGPATAQKCLAHLAAAAWCFESLDGFAAPAATAATWPAFLRLMHGLADPAAAWAGQLEQVTHWYRPMLEQRHDDAHVRAADLDMLVSLAPQFASRERFLTELTLDPPAASGDLSDGALQDEDYLILSTVHSAKGQEWDSVYVLNVADGNFPNEFATGSEAGLEEERRLLYVAITRARDNLHLIEPQRYFVTQQPRYGDAYVHGARSRFLSAAVLARLDQVGAAGSQGANGLSDGIAGSTGPAAAPVVDVAGKLRQMW
jgi:DNA helicase-2/ATP-dependent DNA helicase PcrA